MNFIAYITQASIVFEALQLVRVWELLLRKSSLCNILQPLLQSRFQRFWCRWQSRFILRPVQPLWLQSSVQKIFTTLGNNYWYRYDLIAFHLSFAYVFSPAILGSIFNVVLAWMLSKFATRMGIPERKYPRGEWTPYPIITKALRNSREGARKLKKSSAVQDTDQS